MRPAFTTDKLPASVVELMVAAAAKRWVVVLEDGRGFWMEEARARRFHASQSGSTLYAPEMEA
jgi:hypothetical protein